MRLWMIAPLGLALVTAACGSTDEQRAASGGLGGAAAGAVVGGPVGAVVGGAAGAAGGMLRDDAEQAIDEARAEDQGGGQYAQSGGTSGQLTNQEVRRAQVTLQDMGLYEGQIDGLYGPLTQSAVEQYQQRQGLPQTAALDDRTMNSLRQQAAGAGQGGGMERQQTGQQQMGQDRMDQQPMMDQQRMDQQRMDQQRMDQEQMGQRPMRDDQMMRDDQIRMERQDPATGTTTTTPGTTTPGTTTGTTGTTVR